MPGIYIHIPFCRQACYYCDFHFSTSFKNKSDFIQCFKKEIYLQRNYLANTKIDTVYFGGGTPSVLSAEEIKLIFADLEKYFVIDERAEITLEANPDDLQPQKLQELASTRINRLSIGIQSFSDADLKFLNRSHDSSRAVSCVRDAQAAGFTNLTVDLIYGIQTLTDKQWIKNLDTVFHLNVPHVSCYSLTVEPKTALAIFIQRGKITGIDQEKSARHFEILMNKMRKQKFVHYEISNFCKEGFISKHNSSYWKGEYYLGLGPSAHSYNGKTRQWNVSSNSKYITSIQEGNILFKDEKLSDIQIYNEYILTHLRTMWGVDTNAVKQSFADRFYIHLMKEVKPYVNNRMVLMDEKKIILSDSGKLFADKIASDLFIV